MSTCPNAVEGFGVCTLVVDRLWNGVSARTSERCEVSFREEGAGLVVTVDAPFHGDPAPGDPASTPAPPGRFDGLWEYEVVELFLVAADGAYLELEFGPHGHWLALLFSAPRVSERRDLGLEAIDVATEAAADAVGKSRWRGRYRIRKGKKPKRIVAANAFSIHGSREGRRYLAAHPLPGDCPDFHQPEQFPRLGTRIKN